MCQMIDWLCLQPFLPLSCWYCAWGSTVAPLAPSSAKRRTAWQLGSAGRSWSRWYRCPLHDALLDPCKGTDARYLPEVRGPPVERKWRKSLIFSHINCIVSWNGPCFSFDIRCHRNTPRRDDTFRAPYKQFVSGVPVDMSGLYWISVNIFHKRIHFHNSSKFISKLLRVICCSHHICQTNLFIHNPYKITEPFCHLMECVSYTFRNVIYN